MITFNSLFIFTEDSKKLADFYKKIFEKDPEWEEGGYYGFQIGSEAFLMIGFHDKVHGQSQNPERMMINLETDDVEKEFARIEKLGATVIAKPYHPQEGDDAMLATFADPDGNYFQLNSPWNA